MRIGAVGQFELRTRDAEKAARVALGQRARFVGSDDVVGNGCNTGRRVRLPDAAHRNGINVATKI